MGTARKTATGTIPRRVLWCGVDFQNRPHFESARVNFSPGVSTGVAFPSLLQWPQAECRGALIGAIDARIAEQAPHSIEK